MSAPAKNIPIVHVGAARWRFTRETEGVGFEPTVGFPTLDFESSALNRTQPPFRDEKKNVEPAYAKSFGVASAERPTSNVQRKRHCRCTRRRQCCLSGDRAARHWLNK